MTRIYLPPSTGGVTCGATEEEPTGPHPALPQRGGVSSSVHRVALFLDFLCTAMLPWLCYVVAIPSPLARISWGVANPLPLPLFFPYCIKEKQSVKCDKAILVAHPSPIATSSLVFTNSV